MAIWRGKRDRTQAPHGTHESADVDREGHRNVDRADIRGDENDRGSHGDSNHAGTTADGGVPAGYVDQRRHEEYGGIKGGAVFYGWLVAVALTVLLVGIVSAIASAVGSSMDVTKADAELKAGSIGIGAGVALLIILIISYFAGGYVSGRMARFDGARQGVGTWILGLVITLIVVGVGALFGSQYNVFERVNLPSIPVPTDSLTWGGVVAIVAILVGTLLAALLGGKVGERYHRKIDRVG